MSTHAPDIRIRRVYDPPEKDDGARVLVDRLWPRGLSKEAAALTLWLKEVAPSAQLRTWFGHEPVRWEEFGQRYRAELADNGAAIDRLADLARHGAVTLLYAYHDREFNQAIVLEAYLRGYLKGRASMN